MEFYNIYENNLKHIDFKAEIGQLIVVKGTSGSGKSTLVEKVLYAECLRQYKIAQETNDLYYYTVRPKFEKCDHILPTKLIAQQVSRQSITSTVATRTNLLSSIKKLFIDDGVVLHKGNVIEELDSITTLNALYRFYPTAQFYYLFSEYEEITASSFNVICQKLNSNKVIIIDERDREKEIASDKVRNIKAEKYKILIQIDATQFTLYQKNATHLAMKHNNEWVFFNRSLLDTFSGQILLRKCNSLFSKTTNSVLANYCRNCNGKGEVQKQLCETCQGTGFGQETLIVFIKDKNIFDILHLSLNELHNFLTKISIQNENIRQIIDDLETLKKLSLGHLSLSRSLPTLSAGENQRVKIFNLLKENKTNHLLIFDELSSNLSQLDLNNIKQHILALRKHNLVIMVEHSDFFDDIADNILYLGKEAGEKGGYLVEKPEIKGFIKNHNLVKNSKNITVNLAPLYNVDIKSLSIPQNKLICIIGASGAGKTTLALKLLPKALQENHCNTEIFTNTQIHNNSRSILATYLGCFDELRKIFTQYATSKKTELTSSDFSFNSTGGCNECKGIGMIEYHNKIYHQKEVFVCPICQGSRYSNDVALFKLNGMSIIDVLNMQLSKLIKREEFAFLAKTVEILTALSLDHLSLGRSTETLSGGEQQRLRFATFLLKNHKKLEKGGFFLFFDEPASGLDKNSINKILEILYSYLKNNTVICIEHNPYFIKNSEYIIDLGIDIQTKTEKNIVMGDVHQNNFLSFKGE
ncbi:ATP-binding cassette domain-containing protein [Pasteurella atlantica]|uniref:ATP-binding cassette domain-containing protein n=1 Tax=Pasteurellaceae TaxID=712 RepID=UPI00275AA181|nr:ATP-binding cassette domain-containing protein [Pasteurella atlantica]MDP8033658.1 ATP-binding cassette domain-containing protein [Pasteurella atlantica]MDP8035562.1 ATP-binding cassette domain-containing protein [Pasteurella atlantica]MDP8037513.1 ATP-binding cassette domain-containing protein [Pasteurella atlantica]MDP8047862.1 ATP-binding cassette domain-containing protein [Pasteurella atlantica]MDP8049817.1 ATP-binding cassette domain-containing protein [Pasteurella atlantica]